MSARDADDHATELVRRLNADFAAHIKEGIAFAFGPPAIPGLGTGSGFTMMLQDRGGNSPEYLLSRRRIYEAASERPEIGSASTLFRPSSPQIFLDIDDGKALKLGVPLADVNTSVGPSWGVPTSTTSTALAVCTRSMCRPSRSTANSVDGINMFYVRNIRATGALVDDG